MALFGKDKMLSQYFMNHDEAYSSTKSFDETVEFVEWIEGEIKEPIKNKILIIELKEGVFIRVQEFDWCEELTKLANSGEFDLTVIGTEKFTELTRKYRDPIKSFGNEKIAIWKLGF